MMDSVVRLELEPAGFVEVPSSIVHVLNKGNINVQHRRGQSFESGILLRGMLLTRQGQNSVYSCGGLLVQIAEVNENVLEETEFLVS